MIIQLVTGSGEAQFYACRHSNQAKELAEALNRAAYTIRWLLRKKNLACSVTVKVIINGKHSTPGIFGDVYLSVPALFPREVFQAVFPPL